MFRYIVHDKCVSWNYALEHLNLKEIEKSVDCYVYLFSNIDIRELYSVIKYNNEIDVICGELSLDILENRRIKREIGKIYNIIDININLKEIGFKINKEFNYFIGIKKSLKFKNIFDTYNSLFYKYLKSFKPVNKIPIINYRGFKDINSVLDIYGYKDYLSFKNNSDKEEFMYDILKKSPPKIYEDMLKILTASSIVNL